jgi:hypothetical protein
MVMESPETFSMRMGSPPSMMRSALEVPETVLMLMEAEVPSKVKATPVLGQVSSLVSGLTRPTKRNVLR